MKYYRNRRKTKDHFDFNEISVENCHNSEKGVILQAIINVIVYLVIYLLFFRDNLQYMGMFIGFMLASVLSQIFVSLFQSGALITTFPFIKIQLGNQNYKNYLDELDIRINQQLSDYTNYLEKSIIKYEDLTKIIEEEKLWSKLPTDKDFLNIYLGNGSAQFPQFVKYPSLSYDANNKELSKFIKKQNEKINNQQRYLFPIIFNLMEGKTLAISSKKNDCNICEYINHLILDTAVSYSYEDTKIAIICENCQFLWVKFLPHVWYRNSRLINVFDSEDASELIDLLYDITTNSTTSVVLFVDLDVTNRKDLFIQDMPYYGRLNTQNLPNNFHIIFFSSDNMIPSYCNNVLELSKDNGRLNDTTDITTLKWITDDICENIAINLFRIKICDSKIQWTTDIPSFCSFYQMLGIDDPNRYISKQKKETSMNITKNFPVEIGSDGAESPFCINLSEQFDGPHCLITGTTGSGKSELLKTIILACCLKYSPEFFSFIVIDFKGGAIARNLHMLPHCAGEFTNSNGDVTKRSIKRIITLFDTELKHRDQLFSQYGCKSLRDYHEKMHSDANMKPLPLLMIVVDEVAVFFSNSSENEKKISHLATVGRSYGIHLLLATQSSSGVIGGQIKTNINCKIDFCDSIKGRASICSSNLSNKECQTAIADISSDYDDLVTLISLNGLRFNMLQEKQETQETSIIEEVCNHFPLKENLYNDKLHYVLTQPIEQNKGIILSISEISKSKEYEVPISEGETIIGLADDIRNAKIIPAVIGLLNTNTIIYGMPGMGKTMLLKSLIVSLSKKVTDSLSMDIYVVSNSIEEFISYKYPIIKDFIDASNLYYVFLFVNKKIVFLMCISIGTAKRPLIVILDNCYDIIMNDRELNQMFELSVAECSRYNISYVMTSQRKDYSSDYIKRNFKNVITLYMGDDYDYSGLMRINDAFTVPEMPGIGLAQLEGSTPYTLEVYFNKPFKKDENEILDEAEKVRKAFGQTDNLKRRKLPVMESTICFEAKPSPTIPIGMSRQLQPCGWDAYSANTYAISYSNEGVHNKVLSYIINYFSIIGYKIFFIDGAKKYDAIRNLLHEPDLPYFNEETLEEFEDLLDSITEKSLIVFSDFSHIFTDKRRKSTLVTKLHEKISSPDNDIQVNYVFSDMPGGYVNASLCISDIYRRLEDSCSGLLIGGASHYLWQRRISSDMRDYLQLGNVGLNVTPFNTDAIWLVAEVNK